MQRAIVMTMTWTVTLLCAATLCCMPVRSVIANPDATTDPQPEDASTPTGAARDSDDMRVTAQIRLALMQDSTFSNLARRIRIDTNQQAVILRGTVMPEEMDRLEQLAQRYAGSRQIDNQLTVKPQ
jgi:osmotically-inducible protein OsmY